MTYTVEFEDSAWMRMLTGLKISQINELTKVVIDASLVYECGGDYIEVFRKARNTRAGGNLRKVYEFLMGYSPEDLEVLSAKISEPLEIDHL